MIIILRKKTTQTTPVEEETSPPIPITSQSVRVPQQVNLPPYPERLLVKKPEPPLHKDIEDKLRNVCIKIPLLQAVGAIQLLKLLSFNYQPGMLVSL
jgi:hypothetical protein